MARRLGLLHDVLRHGPRCERWRLFPRPQLTAAAPLIYEQERWPRLRATPRRYRHLASGNEYLFVTRSQRVMQALLQTGRHDGVTLKFNRKVGEGESSRLARRRCWRPANAPQAL